jgi:U4/U6 small nuclear ribonucleoprotein PRP31
MEPTSTLADALLDDLNDLLDSDEEQEISHDNDGNENQDDDGDAKMLAKEDALVTAESSALKTSLSQFLFNPALQMHLSQIEALDTNKTYARLPKKEREQEDHRLVVQSNRHLASLADELAKAHGELAMAYKPKFPELEELLPNFVQYKNAVRVIGNEMDLTKVNDELNAILNSNQIITVSVAGSTTSGRPLTEDEIARVDAAATYIEELLEVQTKLIRFVENSMEALAPSICALIGPSTSARLIGLVGGLAELTKIPSCNLQVIGQVKQNNASRAGMSSASTKRHVGIVAECDLVRSVPKQLQKKALKAVAAKLALAARYDFVNVDTGRPRSAQTGLQFRQGLKEKFEKLQEPDKAPVNKALPK